MPIPTRRIKMSPTYADNGPFFDLIMLKLCQTFSGVAVIMSEVTLGGKDVGQGG
jgi:hypothetical protein